MGTYLTFKRKNRHNGCNESILFTECNNLTTFHKEEANRILQLHPNEPYILFCSDIDKFKLINEEFGYEEGNRVLIEFANVMQSIPEQTKHLHVQMQISSLAYSDTIIQNNF